MPWIDASSDDVAFAASAAWSHPRPLALYFMMAMTVSSWFDIPDIVASSDLIAIAPSRLLNLDPRLKRLKSAPLPLEEVVFSFDLCWDLRTEREPGQRWLRKTVSEIFQDIDSGASQQ